MTRIQLRGRRTATASLLAVAGAAFFLVGCKSATDTLLAAPDPDLIVPGAINNADGAQALYVGAIGRLRYATVTASTFAQEPSFLFSGLLADEWSTSSTFVQNDEVDERNIKLDNASVRDIFRQLERVRTASNQAITSLKLYRATESNKIGEMYFARGVAELQLASDFCNGIPLSDASTDVFVLGAPLSGAEVFARAGASFDSAIAITGGTVAANVDINRAARIGKARSLLGINKAAEAAALVTAALVPTSYSYDATNSLTGNNNNALWGQGASQRRYTVGDSLEGNARNLLVKNAIPFFSAKDPRVPVTYTIATNGRDTTKSQDGFTFSRTTSLWGQTTPVSLANGLDARLIEAEAALQAGDYAGMIAILNALRAAPPKIGEVQPAALAPLAVPTSKTAAEDLYFREKAFWVFGRGQRLNDLRRLIRFYGRTPETTFPTGTHYRGGSYGPDVNLPVPTDELTNPNFKGCTDRKA